MSDDEEEYDEFTVTEFNRQENQKSFINKEFKWMVDYSDVAKGKYYYQQCIRDLRMFLQHCWQKRITPISTNDLTKILHFIIQTEYDGGWTPDLFLWAAAYDPRNITIAKLCIDNMKKSYVGFFKVIFDSEYMEIGKLRQDNTSEKKEILKYAIDEVDKISRDYAFDLNCNKRIEAKFAALMEIFELVPLSMIKEEGHFERLIGVMQKTVNRRLNDGCQDTVYSLCGIIRRWVYNNDFNTLLIDPVLDKLIELYQVYDYKVFNPYQISWVFDAIASKSMNWLFNHNAEYIPGHEREKILKYACEHLEDPSDPNKEKYKAIISKYSEMIRDKSCVNKVVNEQVFSLTKKDPNPTKALPDVALSKIASMLQRRFGRRSRRSKKSRRKSRAKRKSKRKSRKRRSS